eukprot:TRINITY_DN18877_c0_g1_i1.p1 TRINITY_DN18877_c0_g1~~TRINITY_DN18877_c0_g1_i1.p1  ORF type:complete len:1541 (+),score=444.65 TRINITY_DN18877_c0_g1_i1:155-4624(+)
MHRAHRRKQLDKYIRHSDAKHRGEVVDRVSVLGDYDAHRTRPCCPCWLDLVLPARKVDDGDETVNVETRTRLRIRVPPTYVQASGRAPICYHNDRRTGALVRVDNATRAYFLRELLATLPVPPPDKPVKWVLSDCADAARTASSTALSPEEETERQALADAFAADPLAPPPPPLRVGGRLRCGAPWRPAPSDAHPWHKLDLGRPRDFGGVVVRGADDPRQTGNGVSAFSISVSIDGRSWHALQHGHSFPCTAPPRRGCSGGDNTEKAPQHAGSTLVLGGEAVQLMLPQPVAARYVRLDVTEWQGTAEMRAGLLVAQRARRDPADQAAGEDPRRWPAAVLKMSDHSGKNKNNTVPLRKGQLRREIVQAGRMTRFGEVAVVQQYKRSPGASASLLRVLWRQGRGPLGWRITSGERACPPIGGPISAAADAGGPMVSGLEGPMSPRWLASLSGGSASEAGSRPRPSTTIAPLRGRALEEGADGARELALLLQAHFRPRVRFDEFCCDWVRDRGGALWLLQVKGWRAQEIPPPAPAAGPTPAVTAVTAPGGPPLFAAPPPAPAAGGKATAWKLRRCAMCCRRLPAGSLSREVTQGVIVGTIARMRRRGLGADIPLVAESGGASRPSAALRYASRRVCDPCYQRYLEESATIDGEFAFARAIGVQTTRAEEEQREVVERLRFHPGGAAARRQAGSPPRSASPSRGRSAATEREQIEGAVRRAITGDPNPVVPPPVAAITAGLAPGSPGTAKGLPGGFSKGYRSPAPGQLVPSAAPPPAPAVQPPASPCSAVSDTGASPPRDLQQWVVLIYYQDLHHVPPEIACLRGVTLRCSVLGQLDTISVPLGNAAERRCKVEALRLHHLFAHPGAGCSGWVQGQRSLTVELVSREGAVLGDCRLPLADFESGTVTRREMVRMFNSAQLRLMSLRVLLGVAPGRVVATRELDLRPHRGGCWVPVKPFFDVGELPTEWRWVVSLAKIAEEDEREASPAKTKHLGARAKSVIVGEGLGVDDRQISILQAEKLRACKELEQIENNLAQFRQMAAAHRAGRKVAGLDAASQGDGSVTSGDEFVPPDGPPRSGALRGGRRRPRPHPPGRRPRPTASSAPCAPPAAALQLEHSARDSIRDAATAASTQLTLRSSGGSPTAKGEAEAPTAVISDALPLSSGLLQKLRRIRPPGAAEPPPEPSPPHRPVTAWGEQGPDAADPKEAKRARAREARRRQRQGRTVPPAAARHLKSRPLSLPEAAFDAWRITVHIDSVLGLGSEPDEPWVMTYSLFGDEVRLDAFQLLVGGPLVFDSSRQWLVYAPLSDPDELLQYFAKLDNGTGRIRLSLHTAFGQRNLSESAIPVNNFEKGLQGGSSAGAGVSGSFELRSVDLLRALRAEGGEDGELSSSSDADGQVPAVIDWRAEAEDHEGPAAGKMVCFQAGPGEGAPSPPADTGSFAHVGSPRVPVVTASVQVSTVSVGPHDALARSVQRTLRPEFNLALLGMAADEG